MSSEGSEIWLVISEQQGPVEAFKNRANAEALIEQLGGGSWLRIAWCALDERDDCNCEHRNGKVFRSGSGHAPSCPVHQRKMEDYA